MVAFLYVVELAVVMRKHIGVLARLSMRADCPVSCLNSGNRASRAYAPPFPVLWFGVSLVFEVLGRNLVSLVGFAGQCR